MERLIQLWDDIDDLFAMIGLFGERIRNTFIILLSTLITVALATAGVVLALLHPPLALATAILLFVSLLYRSVTQPLEIAR